MITIDLSGMLTDADLAEVEREVNRIIWEDRRTKIFCPSEDERKNWTTVARKS